MIAPAARTARGRRSHPNASRDATPKWPSSASRAHSSWNEPGETSVTAGSGSMPGALSPSGMRSSAGASRSSSTSSCDRGSCVVANSLVEMST